MRDVAQEGKPRKSCVLSHRVEFQAGLAGDEVAMIRLSRSSQRIVVQRLRVEKSQVKRGSTIVAFLSDIEECAGASLLLVRTVFFSQSTAV